MSQTITIDTRFDAPPARIWQAWTQPSYMTWFGSDPEGRVVSAESDTRSGGRFTVTFQNGDNTEYTATGVYDEVYLNQKLSFTWEWANEPGNTSKVVVLLERAGNNGTRMKFTHSNLWDGSAHNYMEGWKSTFAKLADTLADQS
jgi:uncharacterized protein YndB with AHSA1/START domain